MSEPLNWDRDGADWPLRRHSRFVTVGHLRWHVQRLTPPAKPWTLRIWLLHGTGAATHTWRDLAPLLAQHHEVVAVDLPGHGFTRGAADADLSLPGMAQALLALRDHLSTVETPNSSPSQTQDVWVGHSAGAAIALEILRRRADTVRCIVSLNGAVLPWGRFASSLFMPLARSLALHDWSSRFFAWSARQPGTVERLLQDTGSHIDEQGHAFYRRLADNEHHVRSVLRMMALWDLEPLAQALSGLRGRVTLISSAEDRTVPPSVSARASRIIPNAALVALPRWGHLGHEEAPAEWTSLILQALDA